MTTPPLVAWCLILVVACGCGRQSPDSAAQPRDPPVGGNAVAREDRLRRLELTAETIASLGLETEAVARQATARVHHVPGFVVAPPGRAIVVTAPLPGTVRAGDAPLQAGTLLRAGTVALRLVPLAPVDRDVRAQAKRQISTGAARLQVAEARVARLEALVADRAASARALEEARADLEAARADLDAARSREAGLGRAPLSSDVTLRVVAPTDGAVRMLGAAPGQVVAAGASLFEITPTEDLWVRVPVPPGLLARIDRADPAAIGPLGATMRWTAARVSAAPSVDAVTANVDLYFLAPADMGAVVGERVAVELSERAEAEHTTIPSSAIVYDVNGGAWVYTCDEPGAFVREAVVPLHSQGGRTAFERGPTVGRCVVRVGVAELFGAEFGVPH